MSVIWPWVVVLSLEYICQIDILSCLIFLSPQCTQMVAFVWIYYRIGGVLLTMFLQFLRQYRFVVSSFYTYPLRYAGKVNDISLKRCHLKDYHSRLGSDARTVQALVNTSFASKQSQSHRAFKIVCFSLSPSFIRRVQYSVHLCY